VVQEKLIVICGPTAVGKTRLGIELARRFSGEIVSADSQQVWRGFDVGTAKPTSRERAEVRHHLIDVADPSERFDAARFVGLADSAIADISGRGRLPFVVGGTGMYIKMLIHGVCDVPPRDEGLRARLEDEVESLGTRRLHARLAKVDPGTAATISPNDRTRIVRALEIQELTGVPASRLRCEHGFSERRYDALKIGLHIDRGELYRRIDERCDRMVGAGLVGEARGLLDLFGESVQPFASVGYKEVLSHLRGAVDMDEALELMKRNTRRFAKRQMTWFGADPEIRWHSPDEIDAICADVSDFL